MPRGVWRVVAAGLVVVSAALGPVRAEQDPARGQIKKDKDGLLMWAPGVDQPFSQADVDFMAGMIPHHAQAVKMARMAPKQGQRADLKILCERIVVGQGDEIKLMQQWLTDRLQEAPAADATHYRMKMGNMVHDMLMPGMLSDEEMDALSKARGAEWDRLFLVGMIKHHEGAIAMVEKLFKTHGAVQGDDIYKFASDVYADQTTEIEVMKEMLQKREPRK